MQAGFTGSTNAHIETTIQGTDGVACLGTILAFVKHYAGGRRCEGMEPIGTLAGLITASLIIRVFAVPALLQDRGVFPDHMLEDLNLGVNYSETAKAGMQPALPDPRCGFALNVVGKLVLRVLPGYNPYRAFFEDLATCNWRLEE